MSEHGLKPFIGRIANGERLDRNAAREAFGIVMDGGATPSQIGAFLMGLRVRGETVDEITGAVSVMRERMSRVAAPADAFDIVGTGGDGSGSYNVSTCAAFVLAGAGVVVAKHGNRALSSRSGASDVLTSLGVNIDLDGAGVERCIREAGIGFMAAPNHHSAMRHVGPTRVELGTRTIFNLLGPLSNPADVSHQLVGVFSSEWVEPIAHVLKELGTRSAWVVHGDGMDELTTTGTSQVAVLRDGGVIMRTIEPEDAGLGRTTADRLKGGDADHNAAALRAVLDGEAGPYRDIVVLNAAGALCAAGRADDLRQGADIAARSIDSGKAQEALNRLVAVSSAKG